MQPEKAGVVIIGCGRYDDPHSFQLPATVDLKIEHPEEKTPLRVQATEREITQQGVYKAKSQSATRRGGLAEHLYSPV